jgi:hypothetical protein
VTHGAAAACVTRGADVVARGAAHRMAAACVACGDREAGEASRGGSWRGRDTAVAVGLGARSEWHDRNSAQAHACKQAIRWVRPVHAGVALG